MKELPARQRVVRFIGTTALIFAEACGSSTPEQAAKDFTQALADGNAQQALSLLAPDVKRDPSVISQINFLSGQIRGCKPDEVVIRKNPVGLLIGAGETATVTFKEACGVVYGTNTKALGISVGLDRANEKVYINPAVSFVAPSLAAATAGSGQYEIPAHQRALLPEVIARATEDAVNQPSRSSAKQQPEFSSVPVSMPTPIGKVVVAPPEKSKPGIAIAKPTLTPEPSPTPTPIWKIKPVQIEISDTDINGNKAEEGWYWVKGAIMVENTSRQMLNFRTYGIPLFTDEGFSYNNNVSNYKCNLSLDVPPGFRLIGKAEVKLDGMGRDRGEMFLRPFSYCIKVPKNTTGYKLRIDNANPVGVADVIDLSDVTFPTDRPDSDFKEFGATFETMGGKLTFVSINLDEELTRKILGDNKVYKVTMRFENEYKGGNRGFHLNFKEVFGNDGYLYPILSVTGLQIKDQTTRHSEIFGEVGPGITKEFAYYFRLPSGLSGGKLVIGNQMSLIGSDVNAVFNLRLH